VESKRRILVDNILNRMSCFGDLTSVMSMVTSDIISSIPEVVSHDIDYMNVYRYTEYLNCCLGVAGVSIRYVSAIHAFVYADAYVYAFSNAIKYAGYDSHGFRGDKFHANDAFHGMY